MGKEDHDKVVADAIDAVTSSQDVDWDRCASLVPPARRREIENLRALSQAFAARPPSGRAAAGMATGSDPYAGPFVRRLLGAIVAIAALEAAAMLLVLPWVWNEYYREHGDLAVFLTTLFAGHVTTACLLLLAGRRERRTRLLGAYFLLKAPVAGLHMTAASLWRSRPTWSRPSCLLRRRRPGCSATSACIRSCRAARALAIVHMLERGSGSLRVHPDDATSMFELLPQTDEAWVVEAEADAVVAVVGPGAQVRGVLVVGRRFDDRIVRPVDIPFLEALASAAGLALARLRSLSAPAAGALDGAPARACPDCGSQAPGDQPRACACASDYVDTQVPTVLAGKYQLTRHLGTGGTGEVYVARDVRLQRDVAVKTLVGESARRLMTLQPEAWAMATLAHPAAAQIYGIEFWLRC